MRSARFTLVALAMLSASAVLAGSTPARADESIIKNPGDHPPYRFEAEPHLQLGFGGPFRTGEADVGLGFRGTVIIVENGFVPSINNSVGIGFGGDLFFPNNATFFLPVVMQWNFWLSTHWSVFGEPGIGIAVNPDHGRDYVNPIFQAGGRFHFNDKIALTMRVGYPYISVGCSFFF